MNAPGLVSVVVPCHNAAPFVADAVGSALAQGDAVGEVVLVDDGSADATLGVLRQLADEANAGRPGLVRVVAQANGGAPSARNAGLALCTGAFVQFLDADDVLAPGKVARQAALAEAADVVAGGHEQVPFGSDAAPERQRLRTEDAWLGLLLGQLGITSANLFRRSAVEAVGGWDEALRSSQEYDLMFRMVREGGAVGFDPEIGTTVRTRGGSVWSQNRARSERGWVELRMRMIDHLRREEAFTDERARAVDFPLHRALQVVAASDSGFARSAHRRYVTDGLAMSKERSGGVYRAVYRVAGFGPAETYRRLKAGLRERTSPTR